VKHLKHAEEEFQVKTPETGRATVINGLEMLYSQAEKSWEIFQS